MIDPEAARIVRAVQAVITSEKPEPVRTALCDILGVLTAHVADKLGPAERDDLLAATLAIIADEVTAGFRDYEDWKANR